MRHARAHQVIRNAKLWCDVESAPEAEQLSERWEWTLVPGFTASKILWLKNHEPESWAALRRVLLPHDFFNFHLTGRYVMEARRHACPTSMATFLFHSRRGSSYARERGTVTAASNRGCWGVQVPSSQLGISLRCRQGMPAARGSSTLPTGALTRRAWPASTPACPSSSPSWSAPMRWFFFKDSFSPLRT